MSRILRRPMFRGGGTVDSYGKGITAPLVPGYMGGGQIGGGIIYGKPMADGRFGFQEPVMFNAAEMTMPMSTNVTSGLDLLARNKAIKTGAVPFTSYNIPGVEKEKQGETEVNNEATAVEDIDIGDTSNLFGEKDTTETITLPDGSTKQVLTESDGPSTDVLVNLPKWAGGITREEKKIRDQQNELKDIQERLDATGGDATGKGGGADMGGMSVSEIEDLGTGTGTGEGEGEETTELNAKDAIAANQKLFAELLGADKARGQDIGDMLLRFSGSGGNTLGEKFQNYVRAESAAGPSRSEKIKQTAAGLAINDYVAGKRSKEQAEVLKDKIDYEYGKKAALASIQDTDDVSTALAKMSKLTDSSFDSLKNIKALITNKTGRSDIYQGTIKIDDLKKQNKLNKLKPGYNIIEDEGIKRIVEIGKQGDNNVVISIQTIAELWTG